MVRVLGSVLLHCLAGAAGGNRVLHIDESQQSTIICPDPPVELSHSDGVFSVNISITAWEQAHVFFFSNAQNGSFPDSDAAGDVLYDFFIGYNQDHGFAVRRRRPQVQGPEPIGSEIFNCNDQPQHDQYYDDGCGLFLGNQPRLCQLSVDVPNGKLGFQDFKGGLPYFTQSIDDTAVFEPKTVCFMMTDGHDGMFVYPAAAVPEPPGPDFPMAMVVVLAVVAVVLLGVCACLSHRRVQARKAAAEPIMAKVRQAVTEEVASKLFHQTVSTTGFEVARVELVQNAHLEQAASQYFQVNRMRREDNATVFRLQLPEDLDELDRRDKLLLHKFVEQLREETPWANAGSHAQVIPVWHGTSEHNIDAICRTGFACLVNDDAADPGWHANGRYNAVEAELARQYSMSYPWAKPPNSKGEWAVLLSAAIVGELYCITPGSLDYPWGDLPPTDPRQCKFYGGHLRAPADTHIVGIDKTQMLGTRPEFAAYHEVVSAQDFQLLPLAKVFFKSQGTLAVSEAPVEAPRSTRGWGQVPERSREARAGRVESPPRADTARDADQAAPFLESERSRDAPRSFEFGA